MCAKQPEGFIDVSTAESSFIPFSTRKLCSKLVFSDNFKKLEKKIISKPNVNCRFKSRRSRLKLKSAYKKNYK